MAVRAADRRFIRQLYAFSCGYCGIAETENGSELTIDHFMPVQCGGTDDRSNLVYACHACNEFKSDHWNPHGEQRILHPINDLLQEHLIETEDGTLHGLTATGQFHISVLHLNRPPLVRYRQYRHTLETIARNNSELSAEVAQLKNLLEDILTRIDALPTKKSQ